MKRIQNKLPELSIFFPAFNEAGNIEEVVRQAVAVASRVADKWEVIIVNDGSRDGTRAISKRLAGEIKQVRVVSQKNRGYGGALKRGFAESRYDWVFFSDSDLQFDIAELKKLVNRSMGMDMVLGYRTNRAEGKKRQALAMMLKIWNKLFLAFPMRIKDIDCAFKLIHKKVLENIDPLVSDGAMVSTELLLKAYRKRFRFSQVGVEHYLRTNGKSTGSNAGVILKAVKETFVLVGEMFRISQAIKMAKAQVQHVRHLILVLVGFFIREI